MCEVENHKKNNNNKEWNICCCSPDVFSTLERSQTETTLLWNTFPERCLFSWVSSIQQIWQSRCCCTQNVQISENNILSLPTAKMVKNYPKSLKKIEVFQLKSLMLLLLPVPGHFSVCHLPFDLWPFFARQKKMCFFASGAPQWKAVLPFAAPTKSLWVWKSNGKTLSADWMLLWHSAATLTDCYLPDKTHTHIQCVCVWLA